MSKKLCIIMLFAALCACGRDEKNTVGDTNSVINEISPAATVTVTVKPEKPEGESSGKQDDGRKPGRDESVPEKEREIFRSGTWAAVAEDGSFVFFSFAKDGKIIKHNPKDGSREEYSEEIKPVDLFLSDTEQIDEDCIRGIDINGRKIYFYYVSEKKENFTFMSDNELCAVIKENFDTMKNETGEEVKARIEREDWKSPVIVVSAGSVSETYEVDRFTGEGKRINEE